MKKELNEVFLDLFGTPLPQGKLTVSQEYLSSIYNKRKDRIMSDHFYGFYAKICFNEYCQIMENTHD
jgi:hypothetical protein